MLGGPTARLALGGRTRRNSTKTREQTQSDRIRKVPPTAVSGRQQGTGGDDQQGDQHHGSGLQAATNKYVLKGRALTDELRASAKKITFGEL